jgi:pyruvate,water dikinase
MAKRFVPLREVGKASFLQTIDVARAAARALGTHLVDAGTLAEPEDVFFLTADELLRELPAQAQDAVAFRRERYREYVGLDLPDSWTGMPEAQRREGRATTGELRGIAVSPGVYEGSTTVVVDPAVDTLEAGDVLVCRTTDPSWATLMYLAGALVIDIGGPISHGAIVARELGVPCVINTKVAVDSLVNGQRVRVDGGAGTVTPLLQ